MNKFEKLGLSEELLKAINELGFEKPTPIQENIIPNSPKNHLLMVNNYFRTKFPFYF